MDLFNVYLSQTSLTRPVSPPRVLTCRCMHMHTLHENPLHLSLHHQPTSHYKCGKWVSSCKERKPLQNKGWPLDWEAGNVSRSTKKKDNNSKHTVRASWGMGRGSGAYRVIRKEGIGPTFLGLYKHTRKQREQNIYLVNPWNDSFLTFKWEDLQQNVFIFLRLLNIRPTARIDGVWVSSWNHISKPEQGRPVCL